MVRFAISVVYLLSLLACQSEQPSPSSRVLDVFSGFSFVGSARPSSADDSVDSPFVGEHGEKEQSRPKELQVGVQYIFHHRSPVDNESLGLRELPEKLVQKGFKVTKAPQSAENMMQLVIGGPLFRIEFSDDTHTGVISNSPHPNLGDGWSNHDYVLVYLR